MSKTVSGQDVEDMLSSVRRLVSSELPPHRRVSRTPDGEKLVLTDAQRIEPSQRGSKPRHQRLEDRIAELEAAVSKTEDDWEPDGSEDQAQHQPDRIVYQPSGPRRSSTRRISRITLFENDPNAAPDEKDGSAKELSKAERDAVARSASEEMAEHSTFDQALNKAVNDSLKGDASEPAQAPREPKVEQPSARPRTQPLELSPEDFAEDPVAPTHDPKPEKAAAPEVEPKPAQLALSEEELKPLVRKLLLDELQGEIGERITRNVRKLVRQEIQRALTMQELD